MFSLLIFVVHHLVYILVNLTNELVKFIRLLHSFFLLKKKDSLRHSSLNYYYDLFYIYDNNGKRRKIVPTNIAELLTPCALAYWIMDDGGINTYNATILNTDNFTLEEVELLQKALEQKFGLRTRKSEKRKGQWIILIPVRQTVPLSEIVRPHETMLFKVKGLS